MIEEISPSPLSQDRLDLAVILTPGTSPLKARYHEQLQLLFSFYKVWRTTPQHDGSYQVLLITAVSLHPDLLPDQDICLPLGHNWPTDIRMTKDNPPLAAVWNVTILHSMRACSFPQLTSQVILDSPSESFLFRHQDSLVFHKFTADIEGMLSTKPVEFDLHTASFDTQHSKVSSLEQNRKLPYPHSRERFDKRVERIYEEDLNERSSERLKSSIQVNTSVDSHPLTRNIVINEIAATLAQHQLVEKSLRTQPPAMKELVKDTTQEDPPPLASSEKIGHTPPPISSTPPAPPPTHARPDIHNPSELPQYEPIIARPQQASSIDNINPDLNRPAVEQADQPRDLADKSAVPSATSMAQLAAADVPSQLAPQGANQTVTAIHSNLDHETNSQGEIMEVLDRQQETSKKKTNPLDPNQPQNDSFQTKNTRSDASAKNLTTEEKDFLQKLCHHVNTFDSQLVSIYLDPLVTFSTTTCKFEIHYDQATNLNKLCLAAMMSSPKFVNILTIDQPSFVTLIQKNLAQYRQDKDKQKKT